MNRTKRNTKATTLQSLTHAAILKVGRASDAAFERAGQARTQTVAVLTKLEKAFEQRLAKATARLGLPTAAEVRALGRQVAALETKVAARRRRARA